MEPRPNPLSPLADAHVAALNLPSPGFESFTFPRYRPLLLGTELPETVKERIAVGAWLGERPVGLAFYSRAYDEGKKRRLLSIMVSPLLRRQGLAKRLLATGEQLAREQGACTLDAVHSSQTPARAAYEALMRASGWSEPKELEFRLAGRARWALQAASDWAAFLARIGARGYRSTPWNEISEIDRAQIASLVETELPESDRKFGPFGPDNKLELLPGLSLLLRRGNEIVGWILASRGAAADTVRYSSGYVLHKVRRGGWLIAGVRDVCQRQAELLGGDTLSVFETAPDNGNMRRFMERQLKPYSEWTDARYLCEKQIAVPVPEPSAA